MKNACEVGQQRIWIKSPGPTRVRRVKNPARAVSSLEVPLPQQDSPSVAHVQYKGCDNQSDCMKSHYILRGAGHPWGFVGTKYGFATAQRVGRSLTRHSVTVSSAALLYILALQEGLSV